MQAAHAKSDWPDAYLRFLASQRQLSPHSIEAYRRDLRQLLTLSEGRDWADISHAEIRRYTAKLYAGGLDPRSIARKLSSWRGFFAWLSQQTGLAANPVEGVRAPKRAKTLPKALSVDDAVNLVATPGRLHATPTPDELCNQAMFELLYSSGLRVSELTGLDWQYQKADAATRQPASPGWIDLEQGEVTVTGKGGKMRRVPIGQAARTALAAWLAVRPPAADDSAALFLNSQARRISARVLQLRLKAHALAVGTPVNVHPHVLRHSFASHVLQSSGDLRAVQDMLGHASITSTQVYTALDFQHLAEVYDKAHPRAKIK